MTKEIRDILNAYKVVLQEGRQSALATVVHVEGSSYRRPGVRMLIEDNGQLTGAISGGCLEGDALRKALLVMNEKNRGWLLMKRWMMMMQNLVRSFSAYQLD